MFVKKRGQRFVMPREHRQKTRRQIPIPQRPRLRRPSIQRLAVKERHQTRLYLRRQWRRLPLRRRLLVDLVDRRLVRDAGLEQLLLEKRNRVGLVLDAQRPRRR